MPSFGESMKRERELREITLREISEATKINLRYLDALERNDFRHLPGGVFNKGFVRAFAQYIGIDPESMVTAYLQEEQSQQARVEERRKEALRRTAGAEAEIETREKPRVAPGDPSSRSRSLRILGIALILVAALAAVALVAYVRTRGDGHAPSATSAPATNGSGSTPSTETAGPEGGLVARVIVVRRTSGTLSCDDRERRDLGPLLPGAEILMRCGAYLVVDAEDGGAIRLGIGGASPETLGPDGQPVRAHRIEGPRSSAPAAKGAP
jgi:hypothetical protein